MKYTSVGYDFDNLNKIIENRIAEVVSSIAPYDTAVGWPWGFIYRELAAQYPNAKFILTTRASAENWERTYRELEQISKQYAGHSKNKKFFESFYSNIGANIKTTVDFYDWYNAEIQAFFLDQPQKLLTVCWEKGDSWSDLCHFLGEPIPPRKAFPTEPVTLIADSG